MSARNSPGTWDLRCEIREKMLKWLRNEYPEALPRQRVEMRVTTDREKNEDLVVRETGTEKDGKYRGEAWDEAGELQSSET